MKDLKTRFAAAILAPLAAGTVSKDDDHTPAYNIIAHANGFTLPADSGIWREPGGRSVFMYQFDEYITDYVCGETTWEMPEIKKTGFTPHELEKIQIAWAKVEKGNSVEKAISLMMNHL